MEPLMLKEYEIPMDREVAAELNKLRKKSILSKDSLKLIWDTVPPAGTILALALVLIWIFINWLLGFIVTFDFGWNSQYKNYILWPIIGLSYFWIFYEVAKSCGPNSQTRMALRKDLESNIIRVSEYPIYEVKVFEEPEHGGFIYFVRTSGDKILALFDSESQDLSIDGQDPTVSSYKIRNVFKVSRAPNSNIIVNEQFNGDLVHVPESEVFTANTKIWPKHAEFVNCRWEDVNEIYGIMPKKIT